MIYNALTPPSRGRGWGEVKLKKNEILVHLKHLSTP
jgi:hypothetical protein